MEEIVKPALEDIVKVESVVKTKRERKPVCGVVCPTNAKWKCRQSKEKCEKTKQHKSWANRSGKGLDVTWPYKETNVEQGVVKDG